MTGPGEGALESAESGNQAEQRRRESGRKEKALCFIDQAIDECIDLGFSFEQIMALMTVRVREKEMNRNKIRVMFIDCNQEQLTNFVYQFRELVQMDIIPLLLKEFLRNGARHEKLLGQIDLMITTTTHFAEVTQRLAELGLKPEVVAVAAQSRAESLLRLSRLAANHSKIGLICLSPEFPRIVERALARLGVSDCPIESCTSVNPEQLRQFIAGHEVLVAFENRYKEVKALAGGKEVIPYRHELDLGSVSLVRRALEKVLLEKRKGERR